MTIKQTNINSIRSTLRSCRLSTIKELAQKTGLSPATVGSMLDILVDRGEVRPGDMAPSTGGRPSQYYLYHAEYAHMLALSARSGSNAEVIHASVANLYGDVVWEVTRDFSNVSVPIIESVVDQCLQAYPTIGILAFSLPGVVCDGVIVANDYKELEGIHFTKHFQGKYGLPVIVENDINAAVAGFGQTAEPSPAIVGVYFPRRYPPGAGLLLDGRIFRGASGKAGEISWTPLGIDWLTADYRNPQEIAPVISKVICAICSMIDPHHMVLYGDFFTEKLQEAIPPAVLRQAAYGVPPIAYRTALEADMTSGLIMLALSLYEKEANA